MKLECKFVGWEEIQRVVDYTDSFLYKELIGYLFETGGRVSEVLSLMTRNFRLRTDTEPNILVVGAMPLHSRKKDLSNVMVECSRCGVLNVVSSSDECWNCKEKGLLALRWYEDRGWQRMRKPFPINCNDPLAPIILESLKRHREKGEWLIFRNRYTRKNYTRGWAWAVLKKLGDETGIYLYPNRLRQWRACQLSKFLSEKELMEWFTWRNVNVAKHYTESGSLGLAESLGVDISTANECGEVANLKLKR